MLWNILMTFAQFERETISERVRDKIAASKRLGKFCTGMTPMGYCKDPMTRRLVIESSEGRVVKQIFARYLKLRSCGLVARELKPRLKIMAGILFVITNIQKSQKKDDARIQSRTLTEFYLTIFLSLTKNLKKKPSEGPLSAASGRTRQRKISDTIQFNKHGSFSQ